MSKSTSGFTLVEIALVVIIAGLVTGAAFDLYKAHRADQDDQVTRENIDLAHEALNEFFALHGRYPCPANPGLSPTDPDYGEEVCRNYGAGDPCPAGLFCTEVGSRDANGNSTPDPVAIGALPAKTIRNLINAVPITPRHMVDGYDSKFTYAVSELMTEQTYSLLMPANSQLGAIDLRDENNRTVIEPEKSIHFVILSHGRNRKGAYLEDGTPVGGCTGIVLGTPTTPTPGNDFGSGLDPELENCDNNDAIFVSGLRSFSNQEGQYFDDTVIFGATNLTSLWQPVPSAPHTEAYLYNTNLGSVGVGTQTPQERFHVDGTIRTQTMIRGDLGFCDLANDNCLNPSALGGNIADMRCPPGEVATAISENRLICTPLFPAPVNFTCPNPGEFVTSFSNLGTVICGLP